MTLDDVIKNLKLKVLTLEKDYSQINATAGYTSDLLSCVMAGASKHNIWVTLQSHNNIVAVAALLDLSAVIITEGAIPDDTTIQKANSEGVVLLSTSEKSFHVIGKLWELGIRSN